MVNISHMDPQQELIESLEGIHLVNAGAGTGKTYSIVKRYENLVSNNVKVEDILLITFTKNAAEEMRMKVITNLSHAVSFSNLLEAPIMTFHSFCSRLLKKYGASSPQLLGFKDPLAGNFKLLEEPSLEKDLFRKFVLAFRKENPGKYTGIFQLLENNTDVILNLIKKLCSVGIFPEENYWNDADRERLIGDYIKFEKTFDELNETIIGVSGKIVKNKLLSKFDTISREKLYADYDKSKVIGEKVIKSEIKKEVFEDPLRHSYSDFVYHVYRAYIEHLMKRNQMNYEFMVMFAYLVLERNNHARERSMFDYVMIDEFQDTDELQFRLIMLLCKNIKGTANLCVVGDWKQGIYGFRNARIENITEFADNLSKLKVDLNKNGEKISYDVVDHKEITFERNYRSSQAILNISMDALCVPGSKNEVFSSKEVRESLQKVLIAERDPGKLTETAFYQAEDRINEYELVLKKISELVTNTEKYNIRLFDKGGNVIEDRPVHYSDICVLSRTRSFCLELKRKAMQVGMPLNYAGGLEIFSSRPGVLVYAWLKLTNDDKDISGWIPVLDMEGYTDPEMRHLFESIRKDKDPDFPKELLEFRKKLVGIRNNMMFIVQAVLDRYGYNDELGNKIMSVISGWIKSDLVALSDLIRMIGNSSNIEFEIESDSTSNAVLTQTIHNAKGLEYPVVIISNVNDRIFPSMMGDRSNLIYKDMLGLRVRHYFGTNGKYYYKYNNWRSDLAVAVEKKMDYDEERRLLYVAVTRAKQYLYLTCFRPSYFFKEFAKISGNSVINDFEHEIIIPEREVTETTHIDSVPVDRSVKKFTSPHKIMDDEEVEADTGQGKGFAIKTGKDKLEFGKRIHVFALKCASGLKPKAEIAEEKTVEKFLKDLKPDSVLCEVDFLYPEDDRVIRGTIDLVAIFKDRIVVIDYKTDKNTDFADKYQKQIGIYVNVMKNLHPDKKIEGKIFFVSINKIIDADITKDIKNSPEKAGIKENREPDAEQLSIEY